MNLPIRHARLLLCFLLAGCGGKPSLPEGVKEGDLPASFLNSLGMKLVKIPSGTFIMGEEGLEKYNTEGKTATLPLHEVEISCFYVAEKETTKAQFREYVKAKGFPWDKFPQVDPDVKFPPPGPDGKWRTGDFTPAQLSRWRFPGDDWPIANIRWSEAVDFCDWLSEKEGRRYRLPTEAEWEYACRAGTRTLYWWGDESEPQPEKGRMGGDYVKIGDIASVFAPVGHYPPNPWGLYDMHGNVSEWVRDLFDWDYYARSPRKDPQGPLFGRDHVVRGGGGNDMYGHPQTHAGARAGVTERWSALGFRIACDAANVVGK